MSSRLLKASLISVVHVVALALMTSVGVAQPYEYEQAPVSDHEGDSVYIGYRLNQGDEVTYRLVTTDSVVIFDTIPRLVVAERVEMIHMRCDTVVSGDSSMPRGMLVSMRLDDYVATETRPGVGQMVYERHPWQGRTVSFLITPSGERARLLHTDTTDGNAPSGPFRPLLLPVLGDTVSHVGSSANFDSQYWVFDNAYPPASWRGASYRVTPERLDTLGHDAVQVAISAVGRYTYTLPGASEYAQSVSNSSTRVYLPIDGGFPLAGTHESVINLSLMLPSGRQMEGRQVIRMTYSIVDDEFEQAEQ